MVKVNADQKFLLIVEKLNIFLAIPALLYINLANLYLSDPRNYSTVSEYNRLAYENRPENILMYIPVLVMLLVAFIFDLKQPKVAENLKKQIKYVASLMNVLTILIAALCIIYSLYSYHIERVSLDIFANGLTAMMWLLITCFLLTETMEFTVSMRNIKSIVIYGLILLVIYGLFSIPNLMPAKYLFFVFTGIVYLYPKMIKGFSMRARVI